MPERTGAASGGTQREVTVPPGTKPNPEACAARAGHATLKSVICPWCGFDPCGINAPSGTSADFNPCRYCEGEGYIEDVEDMTASWIECEFCDGTGDRYGRGQTLPNPSPETA